MKRILLFFFLLSTYSLQAEYAVKPAPATEQPEEEDVIILDDEEDEEDAEDDEDDEG